MLTFADEDRIEELKVILPTPDALKGFTMYPEEFEKVLLAVSIFNALAFFLLQLLATV